MSRNSPSPPTVYVSDTSITHDHSETDSDSMHADIDECIEALIGSQIDDPELDEAIRELTGSVDGPSIDLSEPSQRDTEAGAATVEQTTSDNRAVPVDQFVDNLVHTLIDVCATIHQDIEIMHSYEIAGERDLRRWNELLFSITTCMRTIRDDIIGAASAHRPEIDTRTIVMSHRDGYTCTMDELIDTCTRQLIPQCRRAVDNLIMHTHTKSTVTRHRE